jgi:DNA-binding CsgD family transcriptional regulator
MKQNMQSKDEVISSVYVNMARAFEQNTDQCVFVVDYQTRSVPYMSNNITKQLGVDVEVINRKGVDFYEDYTKAEDFKMFSIIRDSAIRFLSSLVPVDRIEYTFSYNLQIRCNGQERLILHKEAPLTFTEEGNVSLALCTISFSTILHSPISVIKRKDYASFFEYSLVNHKWEECEGVFLNDNERNILLLSAQGYRMEDIADVICKSIDSVKAYKRVLFQKMRVSSITEAVMFAHIHQLL